MSSPPADSSDDEERVKNFPEIKKGNTKNLSRSFQGEDDTMFATPNEGLDGEESDADPNSTLVNPPPHDGSYIGNILDGIEDDSDGARARGQPPADQEELNQDGNSPQDNQPNKSSGDAQNQGGGNNPSDSGGETIPQQPPVIPVINVDPPPPAKPPTPPPAKPRTPTPPPPPPPPKDTYTFVPYSGQLTVDYPNPNYRKSFPLGAVLKKDEPPNAIQNSSSENFTWPSKDILLKEKNKNATFETINSFQFQSNLLSEKFKFGGGNHAPQFIIKFGRKSTSLCQCSAKASLSLFRNFQTDYYDDELTFDPISEMGIQRNATFTAESKQGIGLTIITMNRYVSLVTTTVTFGGSGGDLITYKFDYENATFQAFLKSIKTSLEASDTQSCYES